MDNVKCGVIRDLLPLVVDAVATEESVELVNAHMETCEGCRGYYEGMTSAIARTANPAPEEDKAFIKLGRKMKRQNIKREWLVRALAAMLGFVIIFTGFLFVRDKTSLSQVDMDIDWADVQLYYDADNQVKARIQMKNGHGWYGVCYVGNYDGIVYLTPKRPEWILWNKGNAGENMDLFQLYWEDGKIVEKIIDYESEWNEAKKTWEEVQRDIVRPISTVRWGDYDNYNTLYISGEELPGFAEIDDGGNRFNQSAVKIIEETQPDTTQPPTTVQMMQTSPATMAPESANENGNADDPAYNPAATPTPAPLSTQTAG